MRTRSLPDDGTGGISTATGGSSRSIAAAAIVLVLLLLAVGFGAGQKLLPPPAKGDNAAASEFSAERAIGGLRDIVGPRPPGSAKHEEVRAHLVEELEALGLTVQVQDGVAMDSSGGTPYRVGSVHNVLAFLEPPAADRETLVVAAHYDTVPSSPGANDDGSQVAAILEAARVVSTASAPDDRNVLFALVDGEETGHLGAQVLTDAPPEWGEIGAVLNLESRGSGGPAAVIRQHEALGALGALGAGGTPVAATSASEALMSLLPAGTDFGVYQSHGWPTVDLAFFARPLHYDNAYDTIDHVDPRSVQHSGDQTLSLVTAWLGGATVAAGASPGLNYFDVLGLAEAQLPLPVIAVLALLCLVGIVLLVVRLRAGRGLLGAGTRLLVAIAAAGVVGAAVLPIVGLITGGRPIPVSEGDFVGMPWIVLLVLATGVATALLLQRRSRADRPVVALALACLGLLATIVLLILLPAAAYLPLLISVPLLIGVAWRECLPGWRVFGRIVTAAVAALAIALFSATTALIVQAFTTLLLPVGAVLTALVASAITAIVELVADVRIDRPARRPRAVLLAGAPVAGLVVVLVVTLLLPAAPSPAPSTLLYCDDRASGEGVWATLDREPDDMASEAVGADAERQSLGACLPPGPLQLPHGEVEGLAGDARDAPDALAGVDPPTVQVLESSGTTRRFAVSGVPDARALNLWLEVDGEGPAPEVIRSSIDGQPVPEGPSDWGWDRWAVTYHAPPETVVFELDLAEDVPVTLRVASVLEDPDATGIVRSADSVPASTNLLTSTPFADAIVVSDLYELEEAP